MRGSKLGKREWNGLHAGKELKVESEKTKGRLQSLDAARGFDMFWIMGGEGLLVALGAAFGFTNAAEALGHVPWHGLHFMDLVFPTFLFLAGVSFPFSAAKSRARGLSSFAIARRCLVRGVMLALLGIFHDLFYWPLDFSSFRVWSVLGRIGLAWMLAAWIYLVVKNAKARLGIAAALLLLTTAVTMLVLAPGAPAGADPFSPEGNVFCWLDRTLTAGHTFVWAGSGVKAWEGKMLFDPEGFAGILPAVVTAMLGMFAGELVRRGDGTATPRKALGLVAGGILSLAVGAALSPVVPVNKALWSPSFALVAGGVSFLVFAAFYWLVDVKGWTRGSFFFRVIGLNSITIYLAQQLVRFGYVNEKVVAPFFGFLPPNAAAIAVALTYIAMCWGFLLFLHRRGIYLKV